MIFRSLSRNLLRRFKNQKLSVLALFACIGLFVFLVVNDRVSMTDAQAISPEIVLDIEQPDYMTIETASGEVAQKDIVESAPLATMTTSDGYQGLMLEDEKTTLSAAEANIYSSDNAVQAILSATKSVVISGTMDGSLIKLPFENGDLFNKGDILAEYNCKFERARADEIKARIRLSDRQLKAYERLRKLDAVAEVEYLSVLERNAQDKAQLKQSQAVSSRCVVRAPFDGRVKDKRASNFEAVRSGRVLMEIISRDPLQAELLVPSFWLRWINVDSPLYIDIKESDKSYPAKIVRVHGQVDPVTQTAHVVAQIDGYKEELLPGMSGLATFQDPGEEKPLGFLGMSFGLILGDE